jgi:hypothetical protein
MKDTGEDTRRVQRWRGGGVAQVGIPPLIDVRPEVTGDAVVGAVLTCDEGIWSGDQPMAFSYAWFQNGTPIIGANMNTYTIQPSDQGSRLDCRVTATNAAGAGSAISTNVYVLGARYRYYANNPYPPVPSECICPATGQQFKIHVTDLNGQNHDRALARLQVGDSIVVDTVEGVLAELPVGPSAGVYTLPLAAPWPVLPDGEYIVSLYYN